MIEIVAKKINTLYPKLNVAWFAMRFFYSPPIGSHACPFVSRNGRRVGTIEGVVNLQNFTGQAPSLFVFGKGGYNLFMSVKDFTIGITGTNGAGKDEVAAFFKEKGFNVYSHSDELRAVAEKRRLDKTRDNLFNLGNELRKKGGNGVLSEIIIKKLKRPAVILSIRHPAEVQVYRDNLQGFVLLGVDAKREIRYKRSLLRKRSGEEKFTYENFIEKDEREIKGEGEVQQIGRVMEMADVTVMNNSTIDDLYKKLEDVYSNL